MALVRASSGPRLVPRRGWQRYSTEVQQLTWTRADLWGRERTVTCGDGRGWTCCRQMACKRSGVRISVLAVRSTPRSRACWPGPRVRRRQARRAGSAHRADAVSPARARRCAAPPGRRIAPWRSPARLRTRLCATGGTRRDAAGLGRAPAASSPARTLTRPDPRRQPRPSLFGVPALDAPMAAPTATDADLKRLDGAGRLTILLDPATPPASSHGVQRSGRSRRVSSETWTLRSVPSADVGRSSRSYVGG